MRRWMDCAVNLPELWADPRVSSMACASSKDSGTSLSPFWGAAAVPRWCCPLFSALRALIGKVGRWIWARRSSCKGKSTPLSRLSGNREFSSRHCTITGYLKTSACSTFISNRWKIPWFSPERRPGLSECSGCSAFAFSRKTEGTQTEGGGSTRSPRPSPAADKPLFQTGSPFPEPAQRLPCPEKSRSQCGEHRRVIEQERKQQQGRDHRNGAAQPLPVADRQGEFRKSPRSLCDGPKKEMETEGPQNQKHQKIDGNIPPEGWTGRLFRQPMKGHPRKNPGEKGAEQKIPTGHRSIPPPCSLIPAYALLSPVMPCPAAHPSRGSFPFGSTRPSRNR